MLLMNEGELLYQGEPTALTQTMAGRSFLMTLSLIHILQMPLTPGAHIAWDHANTM